MSIPLRTIDELRARLALHPTIQEIYVEGLFDKTFYGWALTKLQKKNTKIYPISTIRIGNELLEKYQLTSGERQRVIALANELSLSEKIAKQVLCIIDADCDYVLNIDHRCDRLERTSGTSSELIFWNIAFLEKFFDIFLAVENPSHEAKRTIEAVKPIVLQVFLVRAALQSLNLNWSILEVENEIDRRKPFDFGIYLEKVFNKNAATIQQRELVKQKLGELEAVVADFEEEKKIHGHDFLTAFRKTVTNAGHKKGFLSDPLELGRIFLGSLEWDLVNGNELFNKLNLFAT